MAAVEYSDVLRGAVIAIFTLTSTAMLRHWHRRRNAAALWAAAALASIAGANLAFSLPEGLGWDESLGIVLLLAFPPLLLAFSRSFERRQRLGAIVAGGVMAAMAMWHLALPPFTDSEEGWPASRMPWVVSVLVAWVVISGLAAMLLWRAGSDEPAVVRQRMRTLAIATVGMTIGVLVVGFAPQVGGGALSTFTSLSGLLFYFGFSPPGWLRVLWRQREQDAMRAASEQLMAASSRSEMLDGFLPHVAAIVGADASALVDRSGTCVAAHGISIEDAEQRLADEQSGPPLTLDLQQGRLALWTSPYTPFFGDEELAQLSALGNLMHVALERAQLLEEREEGQARLNEELRHADELKSRFLAMASHELRTPLTAIAGFTSTMLTMGDRISPQEQRRFLEIIDTQTSRLDRLVSDLLTLSSIESGAISAHPVEVDVDMALRQVVEDLGIDAQISCEPDIQAYADVDHVQQILLNYLTNARKYGSDPIEVRARTTSKVIEIRVCDHGHGVPESFVPRLFERFSRASGTAMQAPGTGLGLSIVRGLAEAQGGRAWYEPNEPAGACFVVALPRAA